MFCKRLVLFSHGGCHEFTCGTSHSIYFLVIQGSALEEQLARAAIFPRRLVAVAETGLGGSQRVEYALRQRPRRGGHLGLFSCPEHLDRGVTSRDEDSTSAAT